MRLSSYLIALVAGALVPLGFAPFGFYPVVFLSFALWFYLLRHATPAQALKSGLIFGLGMFGVGMSWIFVSVHEYGQANLFVGVLATFLLSLVLATFPALAAWLAVRFGGANQFCLYTLALPGAWVLLEWTRSWIFTGLPWLSIGYSQMDSPLAALAPVSGVFGVGLVVVLTAGALVGALTTSGGRRIGALGLALVFWAGAYIADKTHWTEPAGDPLSVALVQGSIPQSVKWSPAEQQHTLDTYLSLSESYWGVADVIVWPETAIPMFYDQVAASLIPDLQQRARESHTSLLTGIPVLDRERWEVYNTIMSVGDDIHFYRKHHLVPFGEYLPLRRYIGKLLEFLVIPLGDFTPGAARQPLLNAAGYPVGASVCYEAIFGVEIRRTLPDAAFLVNVSNDGWFGDSLAPHQHLEMTRMRALEMNRSLLRATNTGITAVIDAGGKVIARSEQFVPEVVTAEITPMQGSTPYVRWGDMPVIGFSITLLGLAVAGGKTRIPRKT